LLCAVGFLAFQADRISRLRLDNTRLRRGQAEAAYLRRQNQEIARLRQETAAIAELRAANQGLLALRNEIRQLRIRKEELASERAENQALLDAPGAANGRPSAGPVPAGSVLKAALVDAGFDRPEATVQTLFYGMCSGNLARLAQCFAVALPGLEGGEVSQEKLNQVKYALRGVGLEAQGKSIEEVNQWLAAQSRWFPGYRIASQRDISPDDVEIAVQGLRGGETTLVRLQCLRGVSHQEWMIQNN
jgi:hypothetical protein